MKNALTDQGVFGLRVVISEEGAGVDEGEVVLVGEGCGDTGSLLLLVPDQAHHLSLVPLLQVLYEVGEGLLRPLKQ